MSPKEQLMPDAPNISLRSGMSLRDYFAGRVLSGKAGFRTLATVEEQELCASQCYSMADAMLKERNLCTGAQ